MRMKKQPMLFGVVLLWAVLALFPVAAREGQAVLDHGGLVFVSFLNTYGDTGDPSADRIGWIGWNVVDVPLAGGGAETIETLFGELSGELDSVAFGAQANATTEALRLASLEPSVVAIRRLPGESVETYTPIAFEARIPVPTDPLWLYEWDFDGDGVFDRSGSSPTVNHAYDDDGVYFVQVAIRDNAGGVLLPEPLEVVVANRAPEAAFQTPDEPVVEQQAVAFLDASADSDGRIVAWQWDFGDGAVSFDAAPIHAYAAQGAYTVRLVVIDDDGAVSESYAVTLIVENAEPVVAFQAEVEDAASGLVRFIDESFDPSFGGAIIHVGWDFGDGTYRAGSPSGDRTYLHQYELPGVYDVTLYVIDREGSLSFLTQQTVVPG